MTSFSQSLDDQLEQTGSLSLAKPFRPGDVRKVVVEVLARNGGSRRR